MNINEIKIRQEDEIIRTIYESPIIEEVKRLANCFGDPVAAEIQEREKYALRLTHSSHSKLFAILDEIATMLGIASINFHLFKGKDIIYGNENALIVANKENIVITFTNNILSLLDGEEEVRSVIGHELGHFIFGHVQDPVLSYLIYVGNMGNIEYLPKEKKLLKNPEFNYLINLALIASQLRELNADRIGLIACGNVEPAILASIKLVSGAPDQYGKYDIDAYLQQAEKLQAQGFKDNDVNITHPYECLRAKALVEFDRAYKEKSKSGTFLDPLTGGAIDGYIPYSLVIGNTIDYTEDEEKINTYIYLCLKEIAEADIEMKKREEEYLKNYIRSDALHDKISVYAQKSSIEERSRKRQDIASYLKDKNPKSKSNWMKVLFDMAAIDKVISLKELSKLMDFAAEIDATENLQRIFMRNLGHRVSS